MIHFKQRQAFSLVTAIFIILLMSTVAGFVMNLSGKVIKETTTQYQREQAILYAKSYTEFAIMSVMSNDRQGTTTCINDITATNIVPLGTTNIGITQGYDVRTHIAFIGPNAEISPCFDNRELGNPSSNDLNIIVDVYVDYIDITHPNPANALRITYHRRTLQKI